MSNTTVVGGLILYEYYDTNRPLSSFLQETTGNERLCFLLFRQILEGVAFLHDECNVAHLDLNLDNIFFDETGTTKMTGFSQCGDPALFGETVARGTYRCP